MKEDGLHMDRRVLVNVLGAWSSSVEPLYRLLAQALEKAIVQGDIPAGVCLPSERIFASDLTVSRSTVVAAYALLQEKELVERRHGSGTWVRTLPEHMIEAHRAVTHGSLARSPLFEMLLKEPRALIDLSTSTPGALDALPVEAFTLSSAEYTSVLRQRGMSPLGMPELRQAIAQRFTQNGLLTTMQQILVTTGAQQGITLAASLYLRHGDSVLIENPTYFGALDVFRAAGTHMLPVPVEENGLDTDVLRCQLETGIPRLLYLTPTFHNPTGMLMSAIRRREIARLAAIYHLPVLEDHAFADLELGRSVTVPAPIAAYSPEEPVITIGTLNKLFWDGLRIGWMRAPEAVIARLSRLKILADLGTSLLSQTIALHLFASIDPVKDIRHRELVDRLERVTAFLSERLPSWTWRRPDGGFFLWVKLPSGDADEFAQVALRQGVVITPGMVTSVDGSHRNYMRLPLLLDVDVLMVGMQRLAQAWETYEHTAHTSPAPDHQV